MTNQERIMQLRERGLTVRVDHLRRIRSTLTGSVQQLLRPAAAVTGARIDPRGGKTVVQVFQGDVKTGRLLAIAEARCSERDNYDRRRGVAIALGRALKAIPRNVYDPVGTADIPRTVLYPTD